MALIHSILMGAVARMRAVARSGQTRTGAVEDAIAVRSAALITQAVRGPKRRGRR